jgi:hypothetical protein
MGFVKPGAGVLLGVLAGGLMLSSAGPARAVLIEALDFTGGASNWTVTVLDAGTPGAYAPTYELDGDPTKYGYAANTTDTGAVMLTREVHAPAGFTLSNIRLEARISGYSSWIMLGRFGFGLAPAACTACQAYWTGSDHMSGAVTTGALRTLDASGDANFTDVTRVIVQTEVHKALGHVYQRPDVSQIELYADLRAIGSPNPVDVTSITVRDLVDGFSFTGEVDKVYMIQFSEGPGTTNWIETDLFIRGTGGETRAFDPDGISTGRNYRIVETSLPQPVGAREPLRFRDSGLYAGFNPYFLDPNTPFGFHVVPAVAYEGGDNFAWNDSLRVARQAGKRIICDLIPQIRDTPQDPWYGVHNLDDSWTVDQIIRLADVVDEFFDDVVKEDVYAITLGEEQIFWESREAQLNRLYEEIKGRHPDLPVYQWYSPSSLGSIPGQSWPNLKADGWVADEYFLDQPQMERAMRGFRLLRKPVVQIIWAGDAPTVPWVPTRFQEQHDVCGKYDIPAGYFTWSGTVPWGWSENASPSLKAKFDLVLQATTNAATSAEPDLQSWDTVPWALPVTPLAFSSITDSTPSFREEYATTRTLVFVNDAAVTGFADLRWDSTAVELRPREAGPSQSSVTYLFESPFPISQLNISATGFDVPGKNAVVSMDVLDKTGGLIQSTTKTPGGAGMNLMVPGGSLSDTQFKVAYTLSGTAAAADDLIAGIDTINVVADVQLPSSTGLTLDTGGSNAWSYTEDLRLLRVIYTAEISDPSKILFSSSGLNTAPLGGAEFEVKQMFTAPGTVTLTGLEATGVVLSQYSSIMRIGVSTNGVDLLSEAETPAGESFNGTLAVDLGALPVPIEADVFYVQLFLTGSYGNIRSYTVTGTVN